jgi:hypothetical protein
VKDISDFKRLDKNLVHEMDKVLTHDIPILLQKVIAFVRVPVGFVHSVNVSPLQYLIIFVAPNRARLQRQLSGSSQASNKTTNTNTSSNINRRISISTNRIRRIRISRIPNSRIRTLNGSNSEIGFNSILVVTCGGIKDLYTRYMSLTPRTVNFLSVAYFRRVCGVD